ncbi:MAG: glutathione S-transferase [Rhodospirillaceae bacterium]|nr:glutathione S-transferase [Rhodospirillaceae bacterium]
MSLTLYELHGRDAFRFSPFCWRVLMALAHKGLTAERIPMKFSDRSPIAFSEQEKVPVLVDDDHWVNDSWAIACYLEDAYPDAPSLLDGPMSRAQTRLIGHMVDRTVHPALARVIIHDVWEHTHPDDRAWFKESREKRFGATLESLHADRDSHIDHWRRALAPFRATLEEQPYLCGDSPAYADYTLFGALQWARCSSPLPLIAADDPVHVWRNKLLALFDGFAGRAPGYEY